MLGVAVAASARTVHFYVSSTSAGTISTFRVRDERLERLQVLPVGPQVAALALAPDGATLYASVRSSSSVATLAVDPASGVLEQRASTAVPANLVYLAMRPGGGRLFGTSYHQHVVTGTPLGADGVPLPDSEVLPAGRHPHCIVPEADGRAVLVAVLAEDRVRRIPLDGAGRFVPDRTQEIAVPAGFGPRHIAITRSGAVLVLGETSGALARLDLSAGRVVDTWQTLPAGYGLAPGVVREPDRDNPDTDAAGVPLMWAADLAAAPDARTVYTSERRRSVLSVGSIDDGTTVQVVETEQQPRSLCLDDSGRLLLVSGELADTVTLYRVDPPTGRVTAVDRAPVPAGAIWVTSRTLAQAPLA